MNRGLVLLLAILLAAAAVTAVLVTTSVVPDSWLDWQARELSDAGSGTKAVAIAVSVGIVLGMIMLLRLEFMEERDNRLHIKAIEDNVEEKGETTIGSRSIEALAENAGCEIRGVRNIHCGVVDGVDGLILSCRSTVAMGSNLPEVMGETRSRIKDSVEQLTGLPVARIDVETRYDSAKTKRVGVR
jgi:uncharacterized alkaline shock family protein YloU